MHTSNKTRICRALSVVAGSALIWCGAALAGVNGQNGGNGSDYFAAIGGAGGNGSNHGATDGSANDGGKGGTYRSPATAGSGSNGSGGIADVCYSPIVYMNGQGGNFGDGGVGGGGGGGCSGLGDGYGGPGGGGGGGGGLDGHLTASDANSTTTYVGGNGGSGGTGGAGYLPQGGGGGADGGGGGGAAGLWMNGGLSLVSNASISGGNGGGIAGGGIALIMAGGGSTLTNNNTITAGNSAVAIDMHGGTAASPITLTNNGSIAGNAASAIVSDGKTVLINAAGGSISAGAGATPGGAAVLLSGSANTDPSSVTNAGSFHGGAGALANYGGDGLKAAYVSLIDNPGSINGGVGGGGYYDTNLSVMNNAFAGGAGLNVTAGVSTITNGGTITGGAGGPCPNGPTRCDGGVGGAGVRLTAGSSLSISGGVTAGPGGRTWYCSANSARCSSAPFGGIPGNGGVGVVGIGNTTVTLSGSLAGGLQGALTGFGTIQPNTAVVGDALNFSGGGNALILENGFSITNSVVAGSGDTLELGGSSDAAFDVTTIGSAQQYRGFGAFAKIGTSTWTLSGVNTGAGAWSVQAGTLAGTASIGSLSNSGSVAPGSTATPYGTLTATSFSQTSAGTLRIVATNGSNAKLVSTGTANLGGVLTIVFATPPSAGQKYAVLSASSLSGSFSNVTVGGSSQYMQIDYGATTANTVTLTATPPPTFATSGTISGASGPVVLTLTATNPSSTQTQTFSNGNFSFSTGLESGTNWTVTVTTPPSGQVCSVANGSGVADPVNTNVIVTCSVPLVVTASAPGGQGTITPASQSVASGSAASFTLTPNTGFVVGSVSGDTCTVTQQGASNTWASSAITQACVVTAVFADYPSQCTGAKNYGPSFFDDFSGSVLDPAKWTAHVHGGNLVVANNSVAVSASSGSGFPYVTSVGPPIVPVGDFSVRWIATYGTPQNSGTGSLALIDVLPTDGNGSFNDIADAWQDGTNYRLEVRAADVGTVTNAYADPSRAQIQHDVEYCWIGNSTEVWVDGVRQFQATRNANVPRPAALWFGNPGATFSASWQPFTLYYVEVRALNDVIFKDGFGTP